MKSFKMPDKVHLNRKNFDEFPRQNQIKVEIYPECVRKTNYIFIDIFDKDGWI